MSPRPVLTAPIGEELYASLIPFTERDAENGWALLLFCGAVATPLQRVVDYAADTADGKPGWSVLMDVDRAPAEALPWLAQFKGVRLLPDRASGETAAAKAARDRARIKSTDGFDRGTPKAIRGAAAQRLTGAKTVIVRERYPNGAYTFQVITYTSETPDQAATLRALVEQKPAGLQMLYTVAAGQDLQSLANNHATLADIAHADLYAAGNLLSDQDASLEGAGVGSWRNDGNAAVSRSTAVAAHGAASLAITALAAGNMFAATAAGTAGRPVNGNTEYTARADVRAASVPRGVRVGFDWYNVSGTHIGFSGGVNVTDSVDGMTAISHTARSPAAAAYADMYVRVESAAAGETHYADRNGIFLGASAAWTPRNAVAGSYATLQQLADDKPAK